MRPLYYFMGRMTATTVCIELGMKFARFVQGFGNAHECNASCMKVVSYLAKTPVNNNVLANTNGEDLLIRDKTDKNASDCRSFWTTYFDAGTWRWHSNPKPYFSRYWISGAQEAIIGWCFLADWTTFCLNVWPHDMWSEMSSEAFASSKKVLIFGWKRY